MKKYFVGASTNSYSPDRIEAYIYDDGRLMIDDYPWRPDDRVIVRDGRVITCAEYVLHWAIQSGRTGEERRLAELFLGYSVTQG